MESKQFDQFAKECAAGSRRGLLQRLVAALPVVGALGAFHDADEADAKGRRKRHKKAHKHGKGRDKGKHKKHKKQCKAHSHAKTCAGTCGQVKNNCQKTVDCGPCDCDPPCATCETCMSALVCAPCDLCCDELCCPQANAVCHADTGACCLPDSTAQTCNGQCGEVINNCGITVNCGPCTCAGGCPACQICDATEGQCIPDAQQAGDACGEAGQVCQADGACACEATTCCDDTICVAVCPACEVCDGDGQCVSCADVGQICCNNGCVSGVCCADAECPDPGAPDCVGHACVCAANNDDPCPDGQTCCDDGCANTNTDADHCGACNTACGTGQSCQGGACGIDCGGDFCPTAKHFCENGACLACDVCATCKHTTVQAAINAANDGDTIVICAGTYTGNVTINKSLALIGAGDGSEPASNTIVDAQGSGHVVYVPAGVTATLQWLRITGGADSGGGIYNDGDLTVNASTVTGNTAPFVGSLGGGVWNHRFNATLVMTDCTISDNHADNSNSSGGGIASSGGSVTLNHCTVSGNTARNLGGGIYRFSGTLTLNSGTSVTQNTASNTGGGIYNQSGPVTLSADSLVCNNSEPQCTGFTPPSGFCGACPT